MYIYIYISSFVEGVGP